MSIPKRRSSPKFASRQPLETHLRSAIIQWLEYKLGHLEAALAKAKEMAKISRLPQMEAYVTYNRHAVATTKWLIEQTKAKRARPTKAEGGPGDVPSVNAAARQ